MNSTQLDLWPSWVARLPWGGHSPRSMTRGALTRVLFLKRERREDDRFFADEDQLEMFTGDRRAPPYGGSPTLLPLPGREDGR